MADQIQQTQQDNGLNNRDFLKYWLKCLGTDQVKYMCVVRSIIDSADTANEEDFGKLLEKMRDLESKMRTEYERDIVDRIVLQGAELLLQCVYGDSIGQAADQPE